MEHTIDLLHHSSEETLQKIAQSEERLDELDRDLDEKVGPAMAVATPEQVRELLACIKFMIDLERVGDLLWSLAGRCQALSTRLPVTDMKDLLEMSLTLQKMLVDVYQAFSLRDLDRAIAVLRSDAQIDRIRNLIYFRHVENREGFAGEYSVQVLFMAQALERAGDHVKNLAEEVCHLVSGHTLRHVLRHMNKPEEQMYLEYLKRQSEDEIT